MGKLSLRDSRAPFREIGSRSRGWPGELSHEAGWESILARSGCQAGVSFHVTPAVITQCDTRLLAAEKLRAEGGAASQLVPSKPGCFHSPISTRRMRLALRWQSWGGQTPISSQLEGLPLTPPSHRYLPPAAGGWWSSDAVTPTGYSDGREALPTGSEI